MMSEGRLVYPKMGSAVVKARTGLRQRANEAGQHHIISSALHQYNLHKTITTNMSTQLKFDTAGKCTRLELRMWRLLGSKY